MTPLAWRFQGKGAVTRGTDGHNYFAGYFP